MKPVFYETSIVLIPKPEKDTPKKANLLNEHQCKNPQENNAIKNPNIYQKVHSP
jgi:hypothetical protein